MTVYAGYGGQKLIEECLDRASYIRSKLTETGSHALIEIDGGVTEENCRKVAESGADVIVAGSAVFRSADPKRTVKVLKGVTK